VGERVRWGRGVRGVRGERGERWARRKFEWSGWSGGEEREYEGAGEEDLPDSYSGVTPFLLGHHPTT
jgi:hypothetical protein